MSNDPRRPPDEETWRNRFILLNLTRIGGTIIVLIGLAIWHSDWVEPGGSIAGLPLALIGLAISFGAPRFLSRHWRTPPDR
jgi:hypothetical protein